MIKREMQIPESGPELEKELKVASIYLQKDILTPYVNFYKSRQDPEAVEALSNERMVRFATEFRALFKAMQDENPSLLMYRYTNEHEHLVEELSEKLGTLIKSEVPVEQENAEV